MEDIDQHETGRGRAPAGGKGMLALFYIAAFVASFNEIIINVAIVDIMQSFSVGSVTAQWLVTGYMIVTVVIVAAIAYLSRRFTLRTLFFAGAGCFIAGSVAAMLASSFWFLLASRLVQAVGSGVFIPTMMNVVMAVAPREKLGTYFSVGSSCIVLGPAFGPVIAGIMVTVGGWRAIFAPGCIVFVLLALVGAFVVRDLGAPERPRLDALSVVSMAVGLTCISYGLTQLTYDLFVAVVALAVGVVSVALFVRRQNRIGEPVLNVRPLARPGFSLACCVVVIAMMTT
ncbi:MAG: MFS transporter, partial [Eggerthellaceae bacterium]|nr:MFS transporter [Eggerthellaceae bacterium]